MTSQYLTEDRLAVRADARRFSLDEVLPLANELDKQKADIPNPFLKRIGELGYFGVMIGSDWGGMGRGVFEYALITEELSRAWMSVASIIARGNGMGTNVSDPARRAELLRRSARGDWIGAAALSEPGAGSDLANVQCRATKDGDEYVISGEKRWCGNALNADFILLLARTQDSGEGPRARGLESFLIEKERGSFPQGLKGSPIDKIGYHGITTYHLWFDGLRVSADNLLGARMYEGTTAPQGRAFNATMHGLNVARIHTAARAIGLARGALEDSLGYAQERVQFGQAIAEFQAIRFKLADMATQVEAARSLMYQAAHDCDAGESIEIEAAMAKLFATEMAERVTSEGIQIHGGNGYTTERAVERYWRDARLTTIFEGTSEIQRKIISDRLIGRQ
jgi:alkylation response protein AidB-like acyl-CoA dehydrogenase